MHESASILKHPLLPLGVLSTYAFTIQLNFMVIARRRVLPTVFALGDVLAAVFGMKFCVQLGQKDAAMQIRSSQLFGAWKRATRQNRDQYS